MNKTNDSTENFLDIISLMTFVIATCVGAIFISLDSSFKSVSIAMGIGIAGVLIRAICAVISDISRTLKDINSKTDNNDTNI